MDLDAFVKIAEGIPDNWPGQCRLQISRRRDGSEYIGYYGEPDEHLGLLPTIAEWRALAHLNRPLDDDSNVLLNRCEDREPLSLAEQRELYLWFEERGQRVIDLEDKIERLKAGKDKD